MKHLLISLLFVLSGCSSTGGDYQPMPEASVRPGINKSFLGDDVDVADFALKWEGESREVFVKRAQIVAELGLKPGAVVADVGAGTGAFLRDLANGVGSTGRVLALDIAPDFVEHLTQRAAREGLEQVEARLCGEDSINLEHASIDCALICNVYHHFEFPRNSMQSVAHALRPDGEVVLVDFERIPGQTREWVMGHVRAGKETVFAELDSFGFELVEEITVPGLTETWIARFRPRS